jgi:hypothetical protein
LGSILSPFGPQLSSFAQTHNEFPISEIKAHPKNPNKHSTEQVALLAKLIMKNGCRAPICVSNRSGYITRGHARFGAAMLLGAKKVPVDFQDYETEDEEIADMLADNHIAELSERDPVLLRDILSAFPADQLDLTSYTQTELKALFPPELDMAEANLAESMESLSTKPVPNITWILIGVPYDKHGVAYPHIAALEGMAEITVKTTKIK